MRVEWRTDTLSKEHHLPRADHIVVLDEGTVVVQGTLKELRDGPLDLVRYIASHGDADGLQDAPSEIALEEALVSGDSKPAEARVEKESKPEARPAKVEDDENKAVRGSAGWAPYKFYLQAVRGKKSFSVCELS
jgi:hypothetical protein